MLEIVTVGGLFLAVAVGVLFRISAEHPWADVALALAGAIAIFAVLTLVVVVLASGGIA